MTRLFLILIAVFLACAPVSSFAQMREEDSVFDDTTEALTFNLGKGDIIAWRNEGEGLDSGLALYLSDHKGQELYDITRLHVGEQLYVQLRGNDAYDFLIEDPIVDNRLFMNLGDSEIAALLEFLPAHQGQVPKTKVRK